MIITETPKFDLSCGHTVSIIGLKVPDDINRRKDGWYSAIECFVCKRPRSVIKVRHAVEKLSLKGITND